MDVGIGLIAGLVIGVIVGFLVVNYFVKKMQRAKVEEMNSKADLTLQEAKLTAKRIEDEAKSKANNLMSNAENKHERIKQKKNQRGQGEVLRIKIPV